MLPFVSNMGTNRMMTSPIVQTRTFLTLLGGGPTHFCHLNQALTLAPILVAADGGADTALAMERIPEAVIGDFDSISENARETIPSERLFPVREQDSTDFEKCLQRVEAAAVLALGFVGARLDHTMAACAVLTRFPNTPVILVGEEDICFLAPPNLEIDLPHGTVFSIFPLAPTSGRSEGLLYPIEGLELSPVGRVGTSNEVTGPVRLEIDQRHCLLMVPCTHLETVLGALTR